MKDQFEKKQEELKKYFNSLNTSQKYEQIIALGKELSLLPKEEHSEDKKVKGCQSLMFLKTELTEGQLHFQVYSDALISLGLAALLMKAYEGQSPDTLLTCPPAFIKDIGLEESLTPNRAAGIYNIHLKMQQDALKLLVAR